MAGWPPGSAADFGHRAPTYPRVLDEKLPAAWHHVEQYANNRIEADTPS
jgi:hypothetical protein